MHNIEIEGFKIWNKMQQLQKKIEQWISIKLTRESMWLTKHENRINKRYSSIKISFLSKNELKNAIKKDMIVVDTTCKTVEFINTKLETQCNKCQKFKHITNIYNAISKCQFCANAHNTHDYKCDICKSNQVCLHIDLKCTNCDKKHYAKDASYEIYLALKSNVRNIDELYL